MGLSITTPAAAQPVTVAETRDFARYPFDDSDALIGSLIEAATDHVEQATGRQFVQAVFTLSMRCWPGDVIRLPRSPVLAVNAVRYRNRDGATVTLIEDADYLVDLTDATVETTRRWPVTDDHPAAVEIEFTAGHASDGGSPEDLTANVPARAKVAIKALAAWWFEQREPVAFAAAHETPYHVKRLIDGLKDWR